MGGGVYLRIYGGAILVIAGIAGIVEASSHRPTLLVAPKTLEIIEDHGILVHHTRLSQTAYDLLLIGAWALVILGAVTVTVGLIRYWQTPSGAA